MWIRIRNTGPEYSALRGMARPVSSRSLAGILSRPGSCLGRVASRMSPVFGFEALNIHTALYLPGQIILFFIHKNTKKFFHRSSLWGRNLDILRVRVCKFWDWDAKRWYWKRRTFRKPAITRKTSSVSRLRQAHFWRSCFLRLGYHWDEKILFNNRGEKRKKDSVVLDFESFVVEASKVCLNRDFPFQKSASKSKIILCSVRLCWRPLDLSTSWRNRLTTGSTRPATNPDDGNLQQPLIQMMATCSSH